MSSVRLAEAPLVQAIAVGFGLLILVRLIDQSIGVQLFVRQRPRPVRRDRHAIVLTLATFLVVESASLVRFWVGPFPKKADRWRLRPSTCRWAPAKARPRLE